jgi:hypothetical protein
MKHSPSIWAFASLLTLGLIAPSWGLPGNRKTFEETPLVSVAPDQPTTAGYLPWVALPRKYLFSGSFYTHLSVTEMRIDHVAENSRCTRKNRTFMISASYGQPIGNNLFSSTFELPLLSADRFKLSRLAPATMGDYVIHLSNSPMLNSSAQLVVSARF